MHNTYCRSIDSRLGDLRPQSAPEAQHLGVSDSTHGRLVGFAFCHRRDWRNNCWTVACRWLLHLRRWPSLLVAPMVAPRDPRSCKPEPEGSVVAVPRKHTTGQRAKIPAAVGSLPGFTYAARPVLGPPGGSPALQAVTEGGSGGARTVDLHALLPAPRYLILPRQVRH